VHRNASDLDSKIPSKTPSDNAKRNRRLADLRACFLLFLRSRLLPVWPTLTFFFVKVRSDAVDSFQISELRFRGRDEVQFHQRSEAETKIAPPAPATRPPLSKHAFQDSQFGSKLRARSFCPCS